MARVHVIQNHSLRVVKLLSLTGWGRAHVHVVPLAVVPNPVEHMGGQVQPMTYGQPLRALEHIHYLCTLNCMRE